MIDPPKSHWRRLAPRSMDQKSATYTPPTPYYPSQYREEHEPTEMRWHYTTGTCFLQIVAEGAIRPSTAYVPRGERSIVWFSTNPVWEPSACKGIAMPGRLPRTATFEELRERGRGLVRFGVAPATAPYDFRALITHSGMAPQIARALRQGGRDLGAHSQEW